MKRRSIARAASAVTVRRRRLLVVGLILGLAAAAIPVAAASRWSLDSDGGAPTHGQIDPELEATVGQATGGRLTTIHFYSPALHKVADYLVYLPAGYTPTRPLPAFYLLHGMPGKP